MTTYLYHTDEQGILYTIVNDFYCVGTNELFDNNAGQNLLTEDVILPYTINNIPLTRVGNYSFRKNEKIRTIFIPNTIKVLGYDCFSHSHLVSIQFDDCHLLEILERGIFYSCHEIKNIQLPPSVHSIGYLAFAQTALNLLTVPGKITDISPTIFGYSHEDSAIHFKEMPKILRLNKEFRVSNFSDFQGEITYLQFIPKQTHQLSFIFHGFLFTLINGLSN